ncbi:nucleoside phosphorylase [Heyndrickxia sp. NPDC080065]|uniref:nucleoside phosphorylase n=1 Tax=Heyndrickxia sp. NPDC080065 TaxID=3390568 RepID=UPI003D06DB25
MKLYGEFTKDDWLEVLEITEEDVPKSFVLHGEWEHEMNITSWKKILEQDQWIPSWNAIIGRYNNQKIGFANVFGGPIAASIVHRFAILGTNNFIQTGYFGGLSHDIGYGDILIVTAAEMEDGVSHWYLPNEKTVHADNSLVEEAVKYCEDKGYKYVKGTVFTTGAIMAETSDMVQGWANNGHFGVDMETATTFAVAKKFNKRAIGLLNLSDHIIKGDTFYTSNKERDELEERTDERIREIALHISNLE